MAKSCKRNNSAKIVCLSKHRTHLQIVLCNRICRLSKINIRMYKFKYALGKGKPFSLWIESLFSEIKKVLISLSLLILLNTQRHLCQALELMLERRSIIWSPLKNDMTINWKCATRIMVRNVCFCFWQFNSCQTYSYEKL